MSLRYILGGHLHTFSDCLDFARNQPPSKITFNLTVDELASDIGILRQFICACRWEFASKVCSCTLVCGSILLPATEIQQESALAVANAKLQCYLEKMFRYIDLQGVDYVGRRDVFDRFMYCRDSVFS